MKYTAEQLEGLKALAQNPHLTFTNQMVLGLISDLEESSRDAERYREIFVGGVKYFSVCVWSSAGRWLPCESKSAADYTLDAVIAAKGVRDDKNRL